ncbi:MAG: ABC transporter ATP-binding protein [Oscillospiraceae bacterium]|jgi:ABC-2 type transport system ATP-binding protein|nr:ABC transporter ATP-binding protein [Oscillospiraceae bacterium]
MEQPAVLRTDGLTKKYGAFTALNAVSLTVRPGDIYGLIGRNGAGKTTLFKCVMGLAAPTAGTVAINGESSRLRAERRKMGFMLAPSFFPYLTARDNLEYLCRLKAVRGRGEAERVLSLVGLRGEKKPYKAFSLGMKQRLGIAAALLGAPGAAVLDEPINGLDPQGIIDIRNVIKDIHSREGVTFVISSHILAELELTATVFGFIEQGALLREISREELRESTKKTLTIDTDDPQKARLVVEGMGAGDIAQNGSALVLSSGAERAGLYARALVESGVELRRLSAEETTLEEYFLRLIGGKSV